MVTTDHFVQEIDREIHAIKSTAEEEASYMSYAISLAEERKEGRKEIRLEDLKKLIAKLRISAEQAMDLLDIPQADRHLYESLL